MSLACRILLRCALVVALAGPAAATPPSWGSLEALATGRAVAGPAGWLNWCMGTVGRCQASSHAAIVTVTPKLLGLLEGVQQQVNGAIAPRAEPPGRDFWQADAAAGDCEDFALAKQQKLRAAGLPDGAVRLATARLPNGELHAVLIVETDRGTLVLDNLHPQVVPVASLDYLWLRVQDTGRDLWWRELAGTPALASSSAREHTAAVAPATRAGAVGPDQ